VIAFSSSAIATARAFSTTEMVRALHFVASQPNHGGTDMMIETTTALTTIEIDTLANVTGGDGGVQGTVDWLQQKGDQVLNKFFPSWGVQGQTPTPGGGSAQYRAGEAPAMKPMKSLPKLK
jgi:hypothetical protein